MKKVHIFIASVIVIIAVIVALAILTNKKNEAKANPIRTAAVETVAQCLTNSGTKFYGASWCSHCARQKGLFYRSAKNLPYIECSSTPAQGSPQTQICIDKGITSYPTWEFPNGEKISREITPLDLADKVSCILDDAARSELETQKAEYEAEVKPIVD